MYTRLLLAISALLFIAGAPERSGAQPYGYPYPRAVQVPQGVGCYWFRGRLNCSRYCYWEIDGYRYCTRRLRDAHTQAPELLFDHYAPYPPARGYRSVK
jgi:hypothetical protein